MKRSWVVLLVLGLAAAIAAPAVAGKGGQPGPNPKPTTTTTIQPSGPHQCDTVPGWDIDDRLEGELLKDGATFNFSLFGPGEKYDEKCVDVTSVAGDWTVTVDVQSGRLSFLTIVLRDSVAPGDACWVIQDINVRVGSHTYPANFTPGSAVNACPNEGEGFADNDPRFAFLVFTRGSSSPSATVTVALSES